MKIYQKMTWQKILKKSEKNNTKKRLYRANEFFKYTGISSKMICTILIGLWIGFKMDKWFDTSEPIWLIFFTIFSVVISMYMVIKDFLSSN